MRSIAIQADGKILVLGSFNQVGGAPRKSIARLEANGRVDPGFNPDCGQNNPYHAVLVQPDGRIVIAGEFKTINGVPRVGIARLEADGSVDMSFDPGSGVDSYITGLARTIDGKILASGYFSQYDGVSRSGIVQLTDNGKPDPAFDPGVGANQAVQAVALQSDGKILLGGDFTAFNQVPFTYLVRLNPDGSVDNEFNSGGNIDGPVNTVLLDNGRIWIGGEFRQVNGEPFGRVCRLNPDGSVDASIAPHPRADSSILAMCLQGDGKLLIGGPFLNVNGSPRPCIARLNPEGSLDTSFQPGTGPAGSTTSSFYTLAPLPDGKLVVGGDFWSINGIPRHGIARFNYDGGLDTSFDAGSGPDDTILCSQVLPNGQILLGGAFVSFNGVAQGHLARLNPDGSLDLTYRTGTGANDSIIGLERQKDGKVLAVGSFSSFNSIACPCVIRLDRQGNVDRDFASKAHQPNGYLYAVAVQSDGKILLGGKFTSVGGKTHVGLARLNSDGSLDDTFNPEAYYVLGRTSETSDPLFWA